MPNIAKSVSDWNCKIAGPYVHLTCKFKRWDVFNIATHKKCLEPERIAYTLEKINNDLEEKLDWHWHDIWKNCASKY